MKIMLAAHYGFINHGGGVHWCYVGGKRDPMAKGLSIGDEPQIGGCQETLR